MACFDLLVFSFDANLQERKISYGEIAHFFFANTRILLRGRELQWRNYERDLVAQKNHQVSCNIPNFSEMLICAKIRDFKKICLICVSHDS